MIRKGDRKPQEKEKAEQEKVFRSIVESTSESIFFVAKDGKVQYVNEYACTKMHRAKEDLLGKSIHDIFPKVIADRMFENIQKVFKSGSPALIENEAEYAGVAVWLSTKLIPVQVADGKIQYVAGISRDLTKQKKTEQSLLEYESIYKTLIDTSIDAIVVLDLEANILMVSDKALDMHRIRNKNEAIGMNCFEFVAPERREMALEALKKTYETGFNYIPDTTLLRKDGTTFQAELQTALVKDANGKPKIFLVVIRDISDRKKTEMALNDERRRFKELWDHAPVAYHIVDKRGVITDVNKTETKMLGYGVEEMVGREVFDFILPEQREDARKRFQQKLKEEIITQSENRIYVKKDGTKMYVSINDVIEKNQEKQITGVRTTMIDITERRRSEEDARQSLEKIQLAMESTISAMAKIVEMKDPYTAGHQKRVAQLSCAIAEEMSLPKEQVDAVHMAAVIHDIGKIYVPAEILSKPGKLTEIEFGMIKIHPKVSYDILKMVEFPWPIARIVIQHHERMDGSGYPLGLTGDDIMMEAKILSVADVVEAIAFHRPYRSAVGIDKALEEIYNNRGILYDAQVVDACIKLFKEKDFKFEA
ncbi:MAG: PAS domain S-box protein [Endomicrobiales bacterium]|nr:PAS domain S-box protein [Endomicrobiales bacterium]